MDRIKKTFSSNLDALIEKFRTETNRQSEEEFINTSTRQLTTASPYKPPDTEPSHDIDRQITDLESLIKRLQDEIVDMTTEADKSLDDDNLREWFTKAHYNLEINEDSKNKTDSNKTSTSKQDKTNNNKDSNNIDTNTKPTNSQVFPIIISNFNPLVTDPNNVTDDFVSCIHSPSVSELAANFTEIRKNFSLLWDDVDDDVVSKKGDEMKSDTSATFVGLTDEIKENISNGATGMPFCNSKEDLNKK